MINAEEITILKLGGSLVTDKSNPFSLRKDVINDIVKQISACKEIIIIVHGGGSFGHPLAKQYEIVNGSNPDIQNQKMGVAKTHDAMIQLNSFIVSSFLESKRPAMSLHTSAVFFDSPPLKFTGSRQLEKLLQLNIVPILYGDVIFHGEKSFTILSGDTIIHELCSQLGQKVAKVIFGMEVDGLFEITKDESIQIVRNVSYNELDSLKLAPLPQKTDVTKGIAGKLNVIRNICSLGIPVQMVNGLKRGILKKAIQNREVLSTIIH
jgi:isopentenyl phosphate kinase